MSRFETVRLACPACATPVAFRAVHSVNAVRAPELRDAILDRTFQRATCPGCKLDFRYAPDFTYLDSARRQWIAAHPLDQLRHWSDAETRAGALFDSAFSASTAEPLRELGRKLVPRVTFGWAALREKLLVAELRLDDVVVELCKAAALRASAEMPLSAETELRLVGADADTLHLAWLRAADEITGDVLHVSRKLYAEIAADVDGEWQTLREELTQGLFVDIGRLLIAA